jgi:4-amino-4-deoxy-L-arabinose transferase-like glycosyltransferase
MNRFHIQAALVILIMSIAFQANIATTNLVPDYDEAVYIDVARNLAQRRAPYRSTGPENLYLVHPPLGPLLYSLPIRFVDDASHLLAARIVGSLASLIIMLMTFSLARKMGGTLAGLIAMTVLGLNPFFLTYAHSAYLEPLECVFMLAALLLWINSQGSVRLAALAGVMLGLGFWCKYFAALFGVAILISGIISIKKRGEKAQPLLAFICASCIVALLWPLYACYIAGWDSFIGVVNTRFSGFYSAAAYDARVGRSFYEFAANAISQVSPLFALVAGIAVVWGIIRVWRKPSKGERLLGLVTLCFCLPLLVMSGRDALYFWPIMPVVAIWISLVFCDLYNECGRGVARKTLISTATAIFILIFPIDLLRLDKLPGLKKLYFTGHAYTWRAMLHHNVYYKLSLRKDIIASLEDKDALVGRFGPIMNYYMGGTYSMLYMSDYEGAVDLLRGHDIVVLDEAWDKITPRMDAVERELLRGQLHGEYSMYYKELSNSDFQIWKKRVKAESVD